MTPAAARAVQLAEVVLRRRLSEEIAHNEDALGPAGC